jgi:hypothetical protein
VITSTTGGLSVAHDLNGFVSRLLISPKRHACEIGFSSHFVSIHALLPRLMTNRFYLCAAILNLPGGVAIGF